LAFPGGKPNCQLGLKGPKYGCVGAYIGWLVSPNCLGIFAELEVIDTDEEVAGALTRA